MTVINAYPHFLKITFCYQMIVIIKINSDVTDCGLGGVSNVVNDDNDKTV